jgi:hypothetical protein
VTGLLCAVCAERPATHPDRIDGKPCMVCLRCRGDEATPEPSHRPHHTEPRLDLAKVVAAVAELGRPTAQQIVEDLGLADTRRRRQRVYTALNRLVQMGQLASTGARANRVYEVRPDRPPLPTAGMPGERNPRARLGAEQVLDIRSAVAKGESRRSVALRYDISRRTVDSIAQGIRWGHLTEVAA